MGEPPKIHLVPASFFGIILGLAGLGSGWRAAHEVWGLPAWIGEAILAVTCVVWLILIVFYVAKWILAVEHAISEIHHPVQCCFVGLVGVATMLVAGAVLPYARIVADVLFVSGALFTAGFAVWRTGALWMGERDHAATTGVLYLPAVAGSFVLAIEASALGYPGWGQYAFGSGLFTWFAIESVLLNRLYTASETLGPLRPTIGIQLAPPAVGSLAYLSVVSGPPGILLHAMMGYALLQALLMLRLMPWVWQKSFTPGYWAFSFGATSLASAPIHMIQHGDTGPIVYLAPYLFISGNILIAVLAIGTLKLAIQGRLLPHAPPPDKRPIAPPPKILDQPALQQAEAAGKR
jgi:tellurite resistance protein